MKWAEGFRIPQEAIDRDSADLATHKGDFRALVQTRLDLLRPLRLNDSRIRNHIHPDNPERERLLLLAKGMPLMPSPSYNGTDFATRPRLSKSFLAAAPAVERMFYQDFWSEGLAIILTEPEVAVLPKLGLCLAGWATKMGKPSGRPITNGSGNRSMAEHEYLNSDFTKNAADELYGTIVHPVIGDIPRLIMRLEQEKGYPREDIRLWKFDLRKAFNLLTYDGDAISFLGVELTDGNFMFFLAGVFGLTGMPMAFQVVTRAIVWEVSRLLRGLFTMYVDDGMGACHKDDLAHDQGAAFGFINTLLGDKSIEHSKTATGTSMDFIGYAVCLEKRTVEVSRKNLLKALYRFSQIDMSPGARIPVREMQALASLGSRYGYICHLMRPYVRALYSSFCGKHHHASLCLNDNTKRVIRLFQCLFVAMHLGGIQFSRPFESFRQRPHTWICEYDASLEGIGMLWIRLDEDGTEQPRAYSYVDLTPLQFSGKPEFQNTAEYLASFFCAHGMQLLGVGGEPCLHRGDSKSALAWTQSGTVRSDVALKPALLFGVYVICHKTDIVNTSHLTHFENSRLDIISRGGSWEDVWREDQANYGGLLPHTLTFLDMHADPILHLINPRTPIDTDETFCAFFNECMSHCL